MDNKSRQMLNEAVRVELKETGVLSGNAETFRTLTNRNDMNGYATSSTISGVGVMSDLIRGRTGLRLPLDRYGMIVYPSATANMILSSPMPMQLLNHATSPTY